MKIPRTPLTLAARALRHAWIGLALLLALALGWLLRAGLAPVDGGAPSADTAAAAAAPAEGQAQLWTCSMHPQIQLPAPGKCPICFMDLIPLEPDGGSGAGLRRLSMSPAARALADIRTAPVERRGVTAEVHMVGKLDYDETRLAYITAWVGGRIDRLFVDYTGVEVRESDHMVELYSPELYATQEELLQALRAVRESEGRGTSELVGMARSTLDAARERLRLWGLTAEQVAELEQRGSASYRVTIYAPTSGIVVHKNAQQGMYVETGTRIYTLADLSHLWVRLEAYEQDLPWLRYGQEVEFTTPAWPGEVFHGTVAFIDPVVDARKRTVQVRVNVPNPERKLKPEMFVRAHVHAQVAAGGRVMDTSLAGKWICPMHPEVVKDGPGTCDVCGMDLVTPESLGYVTRRPEDEPLPLVVPASAVLLTGRRAVVYVEVPSEDGPVFEGREVVLGPRAGDEYVVERGLAEGERVVVHGSFKIDSALQIQARPSMMLPEGGGGGAARSHAEHVSPQLARDLAGIEEAFAALEQAEGLDARRAAFAGLQAAVDAADARDLQGEALALWRELAMRLGNAAALGRLAREEDDARAALDDAEQALERVRAAFGHHAGVLVEGFVTPPAFRGAIDALWRAYLDLHEALAGDDAGAASAALERLAQAIEAVDASGLDEPAAAAWAAVREGLLDAAGGPGEGADLEALRAAFEPLSARMKDVVEAFGVTSGEVYEVHCPMAFDFRGASWLQAGSEVLNPYFGEEMLRCGTVRGALPQPDRAEQEPDDER